MSCEYCGNGKHIETEVDGAGTMVILGSEQGEFLVGVFDRSSEDVTFEFSIPRCPMCGGGAS